MSSEGIELAQQPFDHTLAHGVTQRRRIRVENDLWLVLRQPSKDALIEGRQPCSHSPELRNGSKGVFGMENQSIHLSGCETAPVQPARREVFRHRVVAESKTLGPRTREESGADCFGQGGRRDRNRSLV